MIWFYVFSRVKWHHWCHFTWLWQKFYIIRMRSIMIALQSNIYSLFIPNADFKLCVFIIFINNLLTIVSVRVSVCLHDCLWVCISVHIEWFSTLNQERIIGSWWYLHMWLILMKCWGWWKVSVTWSKVKDEYAIIYNIFCDHKFVRITWSWWYLNISLMLIRRLC